MSSWKPVVVWSMLWWSGCTLLDSEGDRAVLIQTDEPAYVLADSTVIEVLIRNESSATLHYNACLERSLEEVDRGRVVQTIPFPNCECLCTTPLAPGEAVPGNLTRIPLWAVLRYPEHGVPDTAHHFRLRYVVYHDVALSQPLPAFETISNTFALQPLSP